MLRTFQSNGAKHADTMNSAEVAMITGMGVVVDYDNKTVALPTAEMGVNVLLVDKERIPTGLNAARTDISDYDDNFTKIEAGEMVKLVGYLPFEKFGSDQFNDAGLATDDMVSVGTNGVWAKATVPSVYQYVGKHNDNGHELIKILVLNTAQEN